MADTLSPGMLSRRIYLGFVSFSLAGSLLSTSLHLNPGPIAPIASFVTLVAGVVALFIGADGAMIGLVGALAIGVAAELVGLATGYPFGDYRYTRAWWPTAVLPNLGPFPLLLPLAWILVAGGAHLASVHIQSTYRPIAAGLLAATVDLVMEPVMTQSLGYWKWLRPGPLPGEAPVLNFFGWWLVAGLASYVLKGTGWKRSGNAVWVLGGHVSLILGLGLIGLLRR